MVRVGIAFLVVCEALLCLLCGALSYSFFFRSHVGTYYDIVRGILTLIISLVSMWAIIGLLRKGQHAWWVSCATGLIVLGLIGYQIWFGITHANPQTDEGDAVIMGIAMLFFAVPAFVVLFLPATRRYIANAKERGRTHATVER